MKTTNEPFPQIEQKKSVDAKKLTFVLLMQNIAGSRNVSAMKRLEALHNDVGALILGEEPTASKELI
jgi:hypothetical protein